MTLKVRRPAQNPPPASHSCRLADEDVEVCKWDRVTNADFISASSILLRLSELKAGSSEQRMEGKPIRNEDTRLSMAYDLIDGTGEVGMCFVY